MMGSEKQIEWANKIKAQIIKDIELQRAAFMAGCPADADKTEIEKIVAVFEKAIAGVNSQQQSRWFIDNRDITVTRRKVLEFSRL